MADGADTVIMPLMQAIAQMEGFNKAGTISAVNKNPGNLRAGKRAIAKDSRGYAVYHTVEDGWADLSDLLAYYGRHGFTLLAMMEKYAPTADKNNPNAYAQFIAKRLNCGLDTLVAKLLEVKV